MQRNCEAVFVRREICAWDVRQATKYALIDGAIPARYRVSREHVCMTGLIDALLEDDQALSDYLALWGGDIDGEEDGAYRCVSLRDARHKECVLVHREGEAIFMAYLPVVSDKQAQHEHMVSMSLATIASAESMGIQVMLPRSIEAGRHRLDEILAFLSTLIDV